MKSNISRVILKKDRNNTIINYYMTKVPKYIRLGNVFLGKVQIQQYNKIFTMGNKGIIITDVIDGYIEAENMEFV